MPALPVKVISPAIVRAARRLQLNKSFDKCCDVPGNVRKIDALKLDQRGNKQAKSLGIKSHLIAAQAVGTFPHPVATPLVTCETTFSQGYTPENAAVTGVYLHGLAGDIAASESCYESIMASDIINSIGKAFNKIRESET